MSRLIPVPFVDLARRMRREAEVCAAIFDLPIREWYMARKEFDLSASHFSGRASTPVGPAAGPHTQLAQNIVLSWLAGGRILELKTVQVNDRLQIPRPCIHVPNVGYNVEWSQELTVPESLREYAKAVYLIEILKKTRGFGAWDENSGAGETIFDASVGYDLEGIRSQKVTGFLRALRNPARQFEELRRQLSGDLREFRDIELPRSISNCVTLSTFHGCPASEIEAMAQYLLERIGMHVVIKFNPTLLGYDAVRELLIERMGYHGISLLRQAFDKDLAFDAALAMMRRLQPIAERCGVSIGAKFTNTLVVANDPEFFPTQTGPYMYLSGRPLHVLAMNLMQRFREELGLELGISFSAGLDRANFAATAACGMVPVTTCTDLLRQGGYARLPHYLKRLVEEMQRCRVTSLEAYVLAARGHSAEAVEVALKSARGGARIWDREGDRLAAVAREHPGELPLALREAGRAAGLDAETIVLDATRIAGRLNGREVVPALADDPRYHAEANQKQPRRVAAELQLYDCINCDLCISACPNDAIFFYRVHPVETPTQLLALNPDGRMDSSRGAGFVIREAHQIAVVHGLCNECSNCEVYCPQPGGPFRTKESVFLSVDDFCSASAPDGFCRRDNRLYARLGGAEMQLEVEPEHNSALLRGKSFQLELQWEPLEVRQGHSTDSETVSLDTALLWRMKTVWDSIFHSDLPNMVNPDPNVTREVAR